MKPLNDISYLIDDIKLIREPKKIINFIEENSDLKLKPFQIELVYKLFDSIINSKDLCILKSSQIGISMIIEYIITYLIINKKDKYLFNIHTPYIANSSSIMNSIRSKVKNHNKHLIYDNNSYILINGNYIVNNNNRIINTKLKTEELIIINLFNEAAFFNEKNFYEKYDESKGIKIVTSTSNGDNFFKDFYNKHINNIKITYNVFSNRDENWVMNKVYMIGEKSFEIQYLCKFI